ncbi:MAG: hypothetical protein K0R57_2098 [Paenibacillaceae bacterium]|jgi:predicted transcriptional regulator|nr:hypothetical protein [Paenibacillaceae bacterium]
MTQKDCPLVMSPCDELKETTKALTDVRLQLREVVTEMRGVNDLIRRVESTDRLATETAEAAKTALKRLDEVDATIKWIIATSITLSGVGIAAITLILKFFGG